MAKLHPGTGAPRRTIQYRDEMQLAAAAAMGEPAAQRQIAELLLNPTRRKVGYIVGADRDADDMTQIAIVEVLRSISTFRGESPLQLWADRVTIRTVMRELRRRKRSVQLAESARWAPTAPQSADHIADLRRVRQRLSDVLGTLSTVRRVALVLHHVEGYGITEVADITGAPINTVRDRLRVARRQLRKRLKKDHELRRWLNGRAK